MAEFLDANVLTQPSAAGTMKTPGNVYEILPGLDYLAAFSATKITFSTGVVTPVLPSRPTKGLVFPRGTS